MRRVFAIALCVLMVFSLTACRDEESPKSKKDKIRGEYFDAGNVKAFVPEGWKAFPVMDAFADEEVDPDALLIIKGGETDLDIFTKPYLRIDFYGENNQMMGGLEDFYDETQPVEPMALGTHLWQGFTTTDYDGVMAILWSEEDPLQFQVSIQLELEDGQKISLQDKEVQKILESIAASDGTLGGPAQEPTNQTTTKPQVSYDNWEGDWYGWWCITSGGGVYTDFKNIAWDTYAHITVDGTRGSLWLWDTETAWEDPLLAAGADLTETTMVLTDGVFFNCNQWLDDGVENVPMDVPNGSWDVDLECSSVSHFANMIELSGTYEDPNDPDNYFVFYIYLRPWGTRWEDVQNGDTSGCIYSDMMPIYYSDWYLPLLEKGYEGLPSSYDRGLDLLR